MERRVMGIADGTSQMRKTRFVKTTGTKPVDDEARIERARMLAGLKGYVTNIDPSVMKGQQVLASYHNAEVSEEIRVLLKKLKRG